MEKELFDEFNTVDDRVTALEFAFVVLAKELDRSQSLDLAQLTTGLQLLAAQLRSTSVNVQSGSHRDLSPVAVQLDVLRVALSSAQ